MPMLLPKSCFLLALLILFVSGATHANALDCWFAQSVDLTGTFAPTGERLMWGVLAAFREANLAGGVQGCQLRLETVNDDYSTATATANTLAFARNATFLGIAASFGTGANIGAQRALKNGGFRIATFGPMTGSASLRTTFYENSINIRAGYDDEVLAQLTYVLATKAYRRIAFMHSDDGFGLPALDLANAAMARIGIEFVHVQVYVNSEIPNYNYTAMAKSFVDARPQAIVMWAIGSISSQLIAAIRAQTSEKIEIMLPSVSSSRLPDDIPPSAPRNDLIVTQVYPHPLSDTSALSRAFRRAMDDLMPTLGLPTDYGLFTQEGYITGRLVIEALRKARSLTRAALLQSVYENRMFQIDELLFGPYSNDCPAVHATASSSGRSSLCYCSQGLRTLWFTRVNEGPDYRDRTYLEAPDLGDGSSYSIADCYGDAATLLSSPEAYSILSPSTVSSESIRLHAGLTRSLNDKVIVIPENITSDAAAPTVARTVTETRLVSVVTGIRVPPPSIMGDTPTINAIRYPPVITSTFVRNEIYFTPTLQQQIFTIVSSVASSTQGRPLYVLHIGDAAAAAEVMSVVEKAVASFLGLSIAGQYRDTSLSPALQATISTLPGQWVILGAKTAVEMTTLLAIAGSSTSTFYFPFEDLLVHWSVISLSNATSSSVNQRLRFASCFTTPMGSIQGSSETFTDPLVAVGYLIERAMQSVLLSTAERTPPKVIDTIYFRRVLTVDSLRLGPFIDSCGSSSPGCENNAGAASVYLVSLSQVNRTSRSYSAHAVQFESGVIPYVDHTTPSWATPAAILGIVIGAVALLIGVLIAIVFIRNHNRSKRYAVTSGDKPFAVLFTDIESSTMLWAEAPEAMGPAIDLHNEVMREVLQEYKMYEVKTIGDAFMIVCDCPTRALAFSIAVEKRLSECEWDPKIVQVYENIARLKGTFDENSDFGTWNGLRVRIAVHYGIAEPKFEENTQRYDYHGNAINTTARVEGLARGGEIMITETVRNKIMEDKKEEYKVAVSHAQAAPSQGTPELRGVTDPIEVFCVGIIEDRLMKPRDQLLPKASGKQLNSQPGDGESSSQTGSNGLVGMQTAIGESNADNTTEQVITTFLSVLPPRERKKVMVMIAHKWRVDAARVGDDLLPILAAKVAEVRDARAFLRGDINADTLSRKSSRRNSGSSSMASESLHVMQLETPTGSHAENNVAPPGPNPMNIENGHHPNMVAPMVTVETPDG